MAAAVVAAGALGAIVVFLVVGARSGRLDLWELLTSSVWDPVRGRFGASAMVWGTIAASVIALGIAAPLGWAAAIGIHEVAPRRWRRRLRAGTEVLAVVPSIVYGLVGVAYVRPFVSDIANVPGGDSLLAAGLVLAVMVLPTVVAVSVDALAGVPDSTREAATACGLTPNEVIRTAVLPPARRGLWAAAILGLARALGETVAVFLVVGRADGRIPGSLGEVVDHVVRPGQTLTTKLNGPESVLAGTSGDHWAALCGLGLVLLVGVAVLTLAGERRGTRAGRLSMRFRRDGFLVGRARAGRDRAARLRWTVAVAAPLLLAAAIAYVVVRNGAEALDPSFWSSTATGASGGGIRSQLAGTVLVVAAAGLLVAPVGLGLGLVLGAYASPAIARWLRTLTLVLAGVPSILLGLWGYWLFSTRLGWGKSWLAGAIVLAVVALPPVVVAVAAAADSLPAERREAALASGLTRDQVVRSVVVPHVTPGLATGLLLGLARAAGETAPLLFTAAVFAGAPTFPSGIREAPVAALPTHVFTLAQDAADPAALRAAWGAALALVAVAGLLVVAAIPARRRMAGRGA